MEEKDLLVEEPKEAPAKEKKQKTGGLTGKIALILDLILSLLLFASVLIDGLNNLYIPLMLFSYIFIALNIVLGIVSIIISAARKNGGAIWGVLPIVLCFSPMAMGLLAILLFD